MADNKDVVAPTSVGDIEESSSYPIDKVASKNADIAASYANQLAGENAYTEKEWRRLRWKLDLRLVPLLWFNITSGAMDKVTPASAALYGFREDTNLYGDRYAWVGSAFYVSKTSI